MHFTRGTIQAAAIFLLNGVGNAMPRSNLVDLDMPLEARNHPNAAFLRVEGNDSEGTIYEGKVRFPYPRYVTTPSGGTHQCDGTNYGSNPTPGPTLTSILAQAGKSAIGNFPFDGTWSDQYEDFFINSIGQSTQTGNQYWGVLLNEAFTLGGGCQSEIAHNQRGMWAYNAFNVNSFLRIPDGPNGRKAVAGQMLTIHVDGNDGNGNSSPSQGASIYPYDPTTGLQVPDSEPVASTDENGDATFLAPATAGKYYYKAYRSDAIRSNMIHFTVKAGSSA